MGRMSDDGDLGCNVEQTLFEIRLSFCCRGTEAGDLRYFLARINEAMHLRSTRLRSSIIDRRCL